MSEDDPKLDPKIEAWRRQSGALTKANAKYRNSDEKWADQQTNPLREFLDTPVDPKDFVGTADRLRKFIESVNCDCDEPGYICERCALLGEIVEDGKHTEDKELELDMLRWSLKSR